MANHEIIYVGDSKKNKSITLSSVSFGSKLCVANMFFKKLNFDFNINHRNKILGVIINILM